MLECEIIKFLSKKMSTASGASLLMRRSPVNLGGMQRHKKKAGKMRMRRAITDYGHGDRNTNVNRLKSRWQWDAKYFSY